MEVPLLFRCPISMELMKDPVTISTGVTYERKNIAKWLHTYKKNTCPATMQLLESFDLTPNHTLKRLMLSWQGQTAPSSSSLGRIDDNEVVLLLRTIESTPFKVRYLKKLRLLIEEEDETGDKFMKFGGIEVLGHIIFQVLMANSDFATFCACEEALGVLYHLPLLDAASTQLLLQPECIKSMAIMLQTGSAEARLHAVTILKRMVKMDCTRGQVISDPDMDIFKSLLELLSDEIFTRASSCALDVLVETLVASRKNRLKAIEGGAVCVLIELLPDANRSKCEKMLFLLKLLCECAEGRSAFADHGLAISVVVKKILCTSELGTKLGVKILWLVSSFLPTERVLEDMLMFGAVKKLLGLLHMHGRSSTKDKALKIIRLHGNSWRQYPCFPGELKDYLISMQDS
ncbi:U box domain-containing protein [Cinnamomum micranthum f. kanehirae]|uniref:U-box domain-containing protein n=1 Tax=Cinnamomum micranthum f. kanehirae TaxID=337451 RepID=A0A443P9D7_9MAGN|nr:U box domain-containing protein [Cinnamomum micranthum f. kanehirae]